LGWRAVGGMLSVAIRWTSSRLHAGTRVVRPSRGGLAGLGRPRSLSLGGLQSARAASAAERNALRTEPQADSPEPQTEGRETCPAPPLPFFPPKAAAKNRSRFLWSALNLDTELLEHLFLRDGGKFWVLFSSRWWEVLGIAILTACNGIPGVKVEKFSRETHPETGTGLWWCSSKRCCVPKSKAPSFIPGPCTLTDERTASKGHPNPNHLHLDTGTG